MGISWTLKNGVCVPIYIELINISLSCTIGLKFWTVTTHSLFLYLLIIWTCIYLTSIWTYIHIDCLH